MDPSFFHTCGTAQTPVPFWNILRRPAIGTGDQPQGQMMESQRSPTFAFFIFSLWFAGFATILVKLG
jgi:hypothetical protein